MTFWDIYDKVNIETLCTISWINRNTDFDTSIGKFKEPDLFTFLENINKFEYHKDIFYDDFYYIINYTSDSIYHLLEYLNHEIRSTHKILPLSSAKELDSKSMIWLNRQNGRNIKEKLSRGVAKAIKRERIVDTYENRILKIFLKKIVLTYQHRDDLSEFDKLFTKIVHWLKGDIAIQIDEHKKIVYNNLLLHHPHYSKIFKALKWLNQLDQKYKAYSSNTTKDIVNILKFAIIAKLHKNTNIPIFPNILNENISFPEKWSPLDINIDKELSNLVIQKGEFCFTNIDNLANKVISNQLKIIQNRDKNFKIEDNFNEVFIDLFKLFPIARINDKTTHFPIMLKQKIGEKIVEASQTEIINLNCDFFTLPEILYTFNIDILKYFIDNLLKYFKNKKLNYSIPDYVNPFDFAPVKKIINLYFKNSKPIPKSILAGLDFIFNNNAQENDVLYFIQIDHNTDIFVTPLKIKYDKKLDNITNGLFLQRHPTKKIGNAKNVLNILFSQEVSDNVFGKFLHDGLTDIESNNILFYIDDRIENLNKISTKNYTMPLNDIKNKVKIIYPNQNFSEGREFLLQNNDSRNLINFQKLVQLERNGHILWTEHLPNLSIEVIKDGYFFDFILIDDKNMVVNKNIDIKEHFIIPKEQKNISFPLKLGDERTSYLAFLNSNDFPYIKDTECKLELIYDYDSETPYSLMFCPLDENKNNILVQWDKGNHDYSTLPEPSYPSKKKWEELESFHSKNNPTKINNLPEWLIRTLVRLQEIYTDGATEIKTGKFIWGNHDKNKKYFCFIKVDGEDVYCHSANFDPELNYLILEEGQTLFLQLREKGGNINGFNISLTTDYIKNRLSKKIKELLPGLKFLIFTIFKDRYIEDTNTPQKFKNQFNEYISNVLKIYSDKNISKDVRESIMEIISALHINMPNTFAKYLLNASSNIDKLNMSMINCIGYCIGNCQTDWQKEIFKNVLDGIKSGAKNRYLGILAKSLWRSENLIWQIDKDKMDDILQLLLIKTKTCLEKQDIHHSNLIEATQHIELLFALLRTRRKYNILKPNDELTMTFINIIDKLYFKFKEKNFKTRSYLEFKVEKPKIFGDVPDLLYASRVYLAGDNKATDGIQILGVNEEQ